MALSQAQRNELIELLVSNVPANAFIEAIREQGVVDNYDVLRKQAPDDLTEARRFIADRVVAAYEARNRISEFAAALYRRVYLDDYLAPKLAAYAVESDRALDDGAKQAAIVTRANTMSSRDLREFLSQNEARVCVVMAANDSPGARFPLRLGTGFLVGPDSVLTAYHTLTDHIVNGQAADPSPGRCCAVFDYYEGDPLKSFADIPPSCKVVEFAKDWHIKSNEDMPADGTFRDPDATQLQLLPSRLDFALIRLAEPVGKQTRQRGGGLRRSWIRVGAPAVKLKNDDRIIIPQHPNGYHQRIDFGRFSQPDSAFDLSNTRLRYDTETEQDTSGAPCFDQRFALVGMHNAAFRPAQIDVRKNQAIRIETIHAVIAAAVAGANDAEGAVVRLWNTSTSAEPRVILGRTILLDWLERARIEPTSESKQRVYAATVKPEDKGNSSGFGKTFTVEILTAAMRGKAEPVVVLGTDRDSLPDSVSDMMRAIGFQLGIDKTFLDTMPPRPSADLPAEAPNADKLRRWASQDVPEWFDAMVGKWGEQQFDQVEAARQRVQFAHAHNQVPSPHDLELAQQPVPMMAVRRRWSIAWIAINMVGATISQEVRDLLAGLIGAKLTENSMPRQLRRLRWIFIGEAPDFLSADQYTLEELDPRVVGADEIVAAINYLADSMAFELSKNALLLAKGLLRVVMASDGSPAASNPTTRLVYFQRTVFPNVRETIKRADQS